jgi:hypothetical protein
MYGFSMREIYELPVKVVDLTEWEAAKINPGAL